MMYHPRLHLSPRAVAFGLETLPQMTLRLAGCWPVLCVGALRPMARESRSRLRPAGLSTLSVWSKACALPSRDIWHTVSRASLLQLWNEKKAGSPLF
jgi:hypothetical protein